MPENMTCYTVVSLIGDPRLFIAILPASGGYQQLGYFVAQETARRETLAIHPGAIELTEGEFERARQARCAEMEVSA